MLLEWPEEQCHKNTAYNAWWVVVMLLERLESRRSNFGHRISIQTNISLPAETTHNTTNIEAVSESHI